MKHARHAKHGHSHQTVSYRRIKNRRGAAKRAAKLRAKYAVDRKARK